MPDVEITGTLPTRPRSITWALLTTRHSLLEGTALNFTVFRTPPNTGWPISVQRLARLALPGKATKNEKEALDLPACVQAVLHPGISHAAMRDPLASTTILCQS